MKTPAYYLGKTGQQAREVIEDFDLSYNLGTAVAYILRAGKKPGNDRDDDLAKAREHITFEVGDEQQIEFVETIDKHRQIALAALRRISLFVGCPAAEVACEALNQIDGN